MKFFSSLLALAAVATLTEAAKCKGAKQCQCLFPDRTHCCVYGSSAAPGKDYDCTRLCKGATRLLLKGEKEPRKCNAGGAFTCASIFTVQDRIPCYNY
ncbi:hypothetical protein BC830DRAFT_1166507 [Chytriomyces sp. MP71]|nr:hypothetical protein BC830DRAFT_1166507 [Chytriomyces sp. MP71]